MQSLTFTAKFFQLGLALVGVIATECCNAADYVDVNLAAYHFDRARTKEKNLNEFNPGIGIEREYDQGRVMLGVYENSYRRASIYALVGYTPIHIGQLTAGIAAGGVSGYDISVAPAFGWLVTYQLEGKTGLNLLVVPSVSMRGHKSTGFLGLQFRFEYNTNERS